MDQAGDVADQGRGAVPGREDPLMQIEPAQPGEHGARLGAGDLDHAAAMALVDHRGDALQRLREGTGQLAALPGRRLDQPASGLEPEGGHIRCRRDPAGFGQIEPKRPVDGGGKLGLPALAASVARAFGPATAICAH